MPCNNNGEEGRGERQFNVLIPLFHYFLISGWLSSVRQPHADGTCIYEGEAWLLGKVNICHIRLAFRFIVFGRFYSPNTTNCLQMQQQQRLYHSALLMAVADIEELFVFVDVGEHDRDSNGILTALFQKALSASSPAIPHD